MLRLLLAAVVSIAAVSLACAVTSEEVDTALIVAIDVSNSVDDTRYKLQMEGIAQALEDPGVIQAIVGGAKGGILFSLVTWSDQPTVNLPWTHIASEADAKAAAKKVRALPRQGGEFTCMARMMRIVSDKIVPQIPSKAAKVVLDVSGDGRDNCNSQEPIEQVRDELVKYGVTVNGLPILEGEGPEMVTPGRAVGAVLPAGEAVGRPAGAVVHRQRQGRPGLLRAAGQRLFRLRPRHPAEVRARGERRRQPRAARLRRRAPELLRALTLGDCGSEVLVVGRGAAPALDLPVGVLLRPLGQVRLGPERGNPWHRCWTRAGRGSPCTRSGC